MPKRSVVVEKKKWSAVLSETEKRVVPTLLLVFAEGCVISQSSCCSISLRVWTVAFAAKPVVREEKGRRKRRANQRFSTFE